MKKPVFILLLSFLMPLQAAEMMPGDSTQPAPVAGQATSPRLFELGVDFWMMPRDGQRVLAAAEVRAAVNALLQDPETYLELRYPAGEMGELWGEELQDWLVALGIVAERIEMKVVDGPLEGVVLAVMSPTTASVIPETEDDSGIVEPAVPQDPPLNSRI